MEGLQERRILNYVVVGGIRSGTGVVQSTLANCSDTICHADLFHPDVTVRRACHEGYFGRAEDPENSPTWFVENRTNPWQYINHEILDNPKHNEHVIGFRVLYPTVVRLELEDLFANRVREGDFCAVHVIRNPVACLVSLKQAKQSGVWRNLVGEARPGSPTPQHLDMQELVEFCNDYEATASRIRAACQQDCLEVKYYRLFRDYQSVMQSVFDFLEMPLSPVPAVSGCLRLKNRPLHSRIANFSSLRSSAPIKICNYLDAEDFF